MIILNRPRYVSFSLYGDSPVYNQGAIRNAERMPLIYPGWKMVVYYDSTVPAATLEALKRLNVELVNAGDSGIACKSMWRFLINDRREYDRYIVRDCDSRINEREAWAVNEWIKSGAKFHVIRDHPTHLPLVNKQWPVLAGMWGCVKGFMSHMETLIRCYKVPNVEYGYDQDFIKHCIWNAARPVALIHDGTTQTPEKGSQPMPVRTTDRFVGERFDEKDVPNADDLKAQVPLKPAVALAVAPAMPKRNKRSLR